MKLLNELKVFTFHPKKLRAEVDKITNFGTDESISKSLLEAIIAQLESNLFLTYRDTKRLFYNANNLTTQQQKKLASILSKKVPHDKIEDFLSVFLENLTLDESFYILRDSTLELHKLDFLNNKLAKEINLYKDFQNMVENLVLTSHSPLDLFTVFNINISSTSNVSLRVLESASESQIFVKKYKDYANQIIDAFDSLNSKETKLALVNSLFKTYMTIFPSWSGTLLNKESFLPIFIEYIRTLGIRNACKYLFIEKVLNSLDKITEVIEKMAELEPKRGRYWKNKGQFYDQIITKQLNKDLLAVVFIIRNFAFVEFAKSGNAIYIYKADEFLSMIQNKNDWKDKNLTVKNFFSRNGGNGTLTHDTQGKWIQKLDAKLKILEET